MPHNAPAAPWLAFLDDLDASVDEPSELHCIGGFAIVHAYGLSRATADIDVLAVTPYPSIGRLLDLAGKESPLRQKHGVYLDLVTIATPPEDYAARIVPLFPGFWRKISLFVLEAHDLALTKLERNFERDRADVAHLARTGYLKVSTLRERYYKELRPYVIGRESWHDQTLELWVEAYFSGEVSRS
jgi:hypothetical protein